MDKKKGREKEGRGTCFTY